MIPAIALKFANKIYQSTFALPLCGGKACLGFSLPQTPLMREPPALGLPFYICTPSEILNQYDVLPPVTNKWHFGHLHGVQKTTLTMIFFCYNIFVTHSKSILYHIIFKYQNSNMLKLI